MSKLLCRLAAEGQCPVGLSECLHLYSLVQRHAAKGNNELAHALQAVQHSFCPQLALPNEQEALTEIMVAFVATRQEIGEELTKTKHAFDVLTGVAVGPDPLEK